MENGTRVDRFCSDILSSTLDLWSALRDLLIVEGWNNIDGCLHRATEAANLPVMMLASCNGGSVNWSNEEERGKTPLMASATVVS